MVEERRESCPEECVEGNGRDVVMLDIVMGEDGKNFEET